MMPTIVPSNVAMTIDQGATAAGSGVFHSTTLAAVIPRMIPITAPSVLRVAASTRNCRMMSRRLAPSDFLIPISCVRSATATSMMFMMTSPPTMRPMAGNAVPAMVMTFFSLSMNASALAEVSMKKLSGSPGCSLRRPRITSRTDSIASVIVSAVGVWTMIPSTSPRGLVKWWSGEL
jgi:hypothetical protein